MEVPVHPRADCSVFRETGGLRDSDWSVQGKEESRAGLSLFFGQSAPRGLISPFQVAYAWGGHILAHLTLQRRQERRPGASTMTLRKGAAEGYLYVA